MVLSWFRPLGLRFQPILMIIYITIFTTLQPTNNETCVTWQKPEARQSKSTVQRAKSARHGYPNGPRVSNSLKGQPSGLEGPHQNFCLCERVPCRHGTSNTNASVFGTSYKVCTAPKNSWRNPIYSRLFFSCCSYKDDSCPQPLQCHISAVIPYI